MSGKDRRIIISQTKQSPLPTCNPNLMPFHIGHTGPAAVSMFLRVENMKLEEEVKEQNEKKGAAVIKTDGEEGKVKEVTVKERMDIKEVTEAKVDSIPPANDSITKDENNDSNTNPNVRDEDVEMKSDSLTPENFFQVQDTQPTDIEMTTVLPTLTLSSSLISIPSSSSSSKTLSGSIQTSASTSTLVSSESIDSSILTTSSSASSSSKLLPQISSSVLKDIDKRFISSFRGRTIHGLTVDLPTGYTGLLLQGDPQPTAGQADRVTRVLNAEVKSGFEGKDGDEEEVDNGTKRGRKMRTRGKGVVGSSVNGNGKGKAREKGKEPTKEGRPKGRLARTAAPKHVLEPEVITVDNEDQEMIELASTGTTEPATEVTDCPSQDLKLINDDTTAPDSLDHDLGVDKETSFRKLTPQSTFSSITLWHADRAVDETRDEYYRTLTEWMALSHEIHRTDL